MTATPIPRTAAMVVFGDLDRSVLDEMPPGRLPITTTWARGPLEVAEAWARVRAEVAAGRRAYVICPLVEAPSGSWRRARSTNATVSSPESCAGLRVGPLARPDAVGGEGRGDGRSFRTGGLDVLVATVVIEVGVDVPEASVIVIEDAWRFGLAQLHQLRGRVGRGDAAELLLLLGEAPTDEAADAPRDLASTNDGFALAEADLDLRGEGTLLGSRQQGRSDLRLASLRRDEDLLVAARDVAAAMVAVDELAAEPDLVDELRLFVDDEEAGYLFKS